MNNIDLSKINYTFRDKPLLIGGKAKEYYELRQAGRDIDFVISSQDYENLAKAYPNNLRDEWGDLGVEVGVFEIWKTILLFDYDYLSAGAIDFDNYIIIALDKLLFLTAIAAIKKEKYMNDQKLIVDKIIKEQYKNFDSINYESL